jgi:hypothetical protein
MKAKTIFCDVLVVGAGASGVAAAISASRRRAKTVLIEKNSFPGGLAITASHRYICGLYPVNHGIAGQIVRGLKKLNRKNKFTHLGKLSVFTFKNKNLSSILSRLIQKEKNLKIFYNTRAFSVKTQNNRIISLKAYSQQRILEFKPKAVIDASGEGIVIKLSQAKSQLAPLKSRQMAGLIFEVEGLRDQAGLLVLKVPYYLYLGVKSKKLPEYFKFTNFSPGETINSGVIKLNLPASDKKRGSLVAQKNADFIHAYLQKVLAEFKYSHIRRVLPGIFEREGRRLYGQHILTKTEVLSARKFPDAIARGYWPIEFWYSQKGQQIQYLNPGQFYEIPFGCIKSKNITNLFATGKCISVTPQALASTRVIGIGIYLGEAAGKAAVNYARIVG